MSNKKLKVLERSISQTQRLGKNFRTEMGHNLDLSTTKNLNINRLKKESVLFESAVNKYEKSLKKTKVLESNVKRTVNKKMGLTPPNQKNIGKVLNRLNRMSIPYDSYVASGYNHKTNTRYDQVTSNKKLNVNKSQKLYESSNKGNQNLRSARLSRYKAEQVIGTNKGYKHGYSGKKDFNKSDIVKDIKRYRTMSKVKAFTPVGLIGLIMSPKSAGQGSDLGKPIPKKYR
tara:strand:- start:1293 stop:1982 length:690 start_codon:yes stop_codon:yes gene_type:complete